MLPAWGNSEHDLATQDRHMETGLDVKRHHSEGTEGPEEQPPMQNRFHRVLEQRTKGANAQTVPKRHDAEVLHCPSGGSPS